MLASRDGKIVCENTLDARLQVVFRKKLPEVSNIFFLFPSNILISEVILASLPCMSSHLSGLMTTFLWHMYRSVKAFSGRYPHNQSLEAERGSVLSGVP